MKGEFRDFTGFQLNGWLFTAHSPIFLKENIMNRKDLAILVGVVTFIGCLITHVTIINKFQNEAVCRGFANYHSLTGEFQFNGSEDGYNNRCSDKY